MKTANQEQFKPYLDILQTLEVEARLKERDRERPGRARVDIRPPGGTWTPYEAYLLPAGPGAAALVGPILADDTDGKRRIVMTPRVGAKLAEMLTGNGIDWVDAAGNCRLTPRAGQLIRVEGRRAPGIQKEARTIRPQGYQVLFALLARPKLVAEPIREIARVAGVGKTAVGLLIERLQAEGQILETRRGRVLMDPKIQLRRWVAGYADTLRPRLLLQRYRPMEKDVAKLREQVEACLNDTEAAAKWGFGGTAGADMLTGYYAGATVTLHTEHVPLEFARTLRLLPDAEGALIVMRTPGPIAYEGPVPRVVHPLLVYTELMAGADDRAWEAARVVMERYLGELQ